MDLNAVAKRNLIARAEKHIDPNRIIFAQRVPGIDEHLARYCLADLFLDTYPYNGHTTCSDALYSCLPVVTVRGESFASRVCSSLLVGVSLAELSADSLDNYYQIASELACNSSKLITARNILQAQLDTNQWPLKSQAYAHDLAEIVSTICE